MGFKTGAYATVWSVESKTPNVTKVRISISRKDKMTGQYVQSFSGFVGFCGSSAAGRALKLRERDRIKLLDVDVTNTYDKETRKEYTNYNCYDFEMADAPGGGGNPAKPTLPTGEVNIPEGTDDVLPFDMGSPF